MKKKELISMLILLGFIIIKCLHSLYMLWCKKKNESTKCNLKKALIKSDNNYQQMFDLEMKLREALTNEDFDTAARLRDEIRKLKKED